MTQGFSTIETRRLSGCLGRLMPHVRPTRVAITGGVGIQVGMASVGRTGPRETIADLDLVAAHGEVLGRPVPHVAPEALQPNTYGIEADRSCERCALSRDPAWPLAAKDLICELLGWTRQPTVRVPPAADGLDSVRSR